MVALAQSKWREFEDILYGKEEFFLMPDGNIPLNSAYGILKAVHYAQLDLYFGEARDWEDLVAGFLSCPSGFLIIQYYVVLAKGIFVVER